MNPFVIFRISHIIHVLVEMFRSHHHRETHDPPPMTLAYLRYAQTHFDTHAKRLRAICITANALYLFSLIGVTYLIVSVLITPHHPWMPTASTPRPIATAIWASPLMMYGACLFLHEFVLTMWVEDTAFRTLLPKALAFLPYETNYSRLGHLSRLTINESGLIQHAYTDAEGQHLISLVEGQKLAQFSEVTLKKEKADLEFLKGGELTPIICAIPEDTVFKGVMGVVDIPSIHRIKGDLYILPDALEGKVGVGVSQMLEAKHHQGIPMVRMDNVAFEQAFRVYADNAVEANYLLTPALLERLAETQAFLNVPIALRFSQGRLYMALHGMRLVTTEQASTVQGLWLTLNKIDALMRIAETLCLTVDQHDQPASYQEHMA